MRFTVLDENDSPCQACGACCTLAPTKMPGERRWPAKWPMEASIWSVKQLKQVDGQCIFLQGEIGKQTGCKVYSDRPKCCSEFPVGGAHCNRARVKKDLPVLLPAGMPSKVRSKGKSPIIGTVMGPAYREPGKLAMWWDEDEFKGPPCTVSLDDVEVIDS